MERASARPPPVRRVVSARSSMRFPGHRPTVELGSGIGKLKEYKPDAITTDVESTPWAEAVVDAEALPYADGELANLVLLDVFHHLGDRDAIPGRGTASARAGRARRDRRPLLFAVLDTDLQTLPP